VMAIVPAAAAAVAGDDDADMAELMGGGHVKSPTVSDAGGVADAGVTVSVTTESQAAEARQLIDQASKLIDLRGSMKPPTFSGKAEDWMDYRWTLEAMLSLLGDFVPSMRATVTVEDRHLALAALTPVQQARSRLLYQLLVAGCNGKARCMIRLIPQGCGYLAWKALLHEFEPSASSRHISLLLGVLSPDWTGGEFEECLMKWEREVADYELCSASVVPDNFKTAILLRHAPEEIRRMLRGASS